MLNHFVPFFLTGMLLLSCPASAETSRPNILFAFADDWGRYASAYAAIEQGGPSDIVSTPNFDRIAKEGVLFTNAFVNAPSCTPCRSSLLSGQYFWRTGRGAILQGAIWDENIPSYPLILQKAGYHIGHTYKVWSPGSPANAPYGARATSYGKKGSRFNGFSQFVDKQDDAEVGRNTLLNEVRGNFKDFLADREDGEPFCYWWGPTNCHRKWIQGSGKKLWGLNPDDLKGKLPGCLPDVPIVREDFADYLGEAMAFDAGLGVLLDELKETGEIDNTIIVVSGDHGAPGFPNGKCNLYDFGTHVPLAVRWPKQVPGDRVVHDFVCLPDLAATFVDAGGETVPQVMTGKSLLPVLTSDKSGVVDPMRDSVITGRERHVARARTDWMPYPQRAIRTENFLYIRNFKPDRWPMGTGPGYGAAAGEMPAFEALRENTFAAFGDLDGSPTKAWIALNCENNPKQRKYFDFAFAQRPEEELYDLKLDSHQVHNVAAEDRYAQVKSDLSSRLMQVLKETGDPRVTGDGSTFDKPPFATEWKRPAPGRKKK
ncbi:MAG: sulfatase [Fuerstiella sp.]|nr:sulfatase [Fuerstiella sp.]MCP4857597.1 sulfatase [Fuerstiella sp.]